MDHDPSQSQPIVIPGHDNEQPSGTSPSSSNINGQFIPESFQTARSFKTSPKEFAFSSSVNSTHSQNLNNSYSSQFVNNFNSLRNPFTSASPTSKFSPRADPPSYSQRNSIVDSGSSFNANSGFVSGPRPSLLTSKLASSSNLTQQLPASSINSSTEYDQSLPQQQTYFHNDSSHNSFSHSNLPERSSNIEIQPPFTSSHFNQSELVNSYTPYHNTPSVISSSYSSVQNSIPNHITQFPQQPQVSHHQVQQQQTPGVSSSFPNAATQTNKFHEPSSNVFTEQAQPVNFSNDFNAPTDTRHHDSNGHSQYVDYQKPMKSPEFRPSETSSSAQTQTQTNSTASTTSINDESVHLDIVNHPVDDLLLMLSALLQKIIEANDTLHPHHYHNASKFHDTNKFTANVLAFHGRNVPAISIHAYLSRILKYCPVTNEVFLTLLVYFDRIAKRANVNDNLDAPNANEGEVEEQFSNEEKDKNNTNNNSPSTGPNLDDQLFVMDSYNIHRLIISGITVASKFFSDIFYKNSRYAKVGGLPLDELNHLELQFLLLLDFKLLIQIEELQRYADLLLKFWRREQAKKSEKKEDETRGNNDGDEEIKDQQ